MADTAPWNRRVREPAEPHLLRLQKRMARGASLEEAAEAVGLTLPLAKSVFIRSGLPVPKPLKRRSDTGELGVRLHAYLLKVDRSTVAEAAAALGVTKDQVRQKVWAADKHRLVRPTPSAQRYSDTAILLGLQLMALERGRQTYARGPVAVSAGWWDEHRDPAAHPPSVEVQRRWGGWAKACEAAGIPVRVTVRPNGPSRRWTDAQLEQVVRDYLAAGHSGTMASYSAWAADRPDLPSGATLIHRLGGWPVLRERYGS